MRGSLKIGASISGLYAILDLPLRHALDPLSALSAMLEGGARAVQLRAKGARPTRELVVELGARCLAAEVPLIINDALELAALGIPGVAGVHLGQSDLAEMGTTPAQRQARCRALQQSGLWLGLSTHTPDQLRETIEQFAPDYVGYGPVFATASKQDPDPTVGITGLSEACALASVPVVAIGGITRESLPSVASAGADAFAVISALAAPTPAQISERARSLCEAFISVR